MTQVTLTLTEFLLARIAEDEVGASDWPDDELPPLAPDGHLWTTPNGQPIYGGKRRVLAECEAKRRIVALHKASDKNPAYSLRGTPSTCSVCVGFHADMDCENEPWPCETLRLLALPYADHPDYRDEWRP